MCQWFAPTKLVITFERKGKGAFREDEIEHIAVRNKKGEVVSLKLPEKFVYIANHQVRVCPRVTCPLVLPSASLGLRGLVVRMVFSLLHWPGSP